MTFSMEQYKELVQLAELYILQEHKVTDRLMSSTETYSYFKQLAASKKKEQSPNKNPSPSPLQKPAPVPAKFVKEPSPPLATLSNSPTSSSSSKETLEPAKIHIQPPAPPSYPERASFNLEPMPAPKLRDFSELRHILKEQAPGLKLYDEISVHPPAFAVNILVLFLPSTQTSRSLLDNMTKAINQHLTSAQLVDALPIEKDTAWDKILSSPSLRLIVIPECDLIKLPLLAALCQKNEHGQTLLKHVPALLIPDPEELAKNPSLKQPIWNFLKAFLKS